MTHGTRLLVRRLVPLALVVSVPLSACSAWAPVDKQGAPVAAVTELSLGAADPQDGELRYFVDAVDQLSEHRVRVRVDSATYDSETPGGEAALTDAVRAGTVELGYVPSRDLATDGAPAFVALHSPLLLGETSAAVAVAESPLARDVLSSLDDRGLHGLGLVPLESRRLFSRQPILGLGDLKGARVRINDSAQSASLVSSWSGIPVQGYQAEQTKADLAAGGLEAVESSPSYAVTNAYFGPAPYLSSFGLFPKLEALVANPQAWDRLSADDRAALESAAAKTLARAATETARQEAEALSQLCSRAVVVVRPSDAALGALSAAAAQAQPGDAQAMAWTVRLREFLTTAGVAASATPSECTVATDAVSARKAHSDGVPPSAAPAPSASAAASRFPVGTYTTFVTREQWQAADDTSNLSTLDVTFTSTFGADGTFTQSLEPNPPGQGPFEGTWKVAGDRLVLDYHLVATPSERYTETVRWSYLRGDLRFVVVDVPDTGSTVIYQQPWHKVG